MLTRRLLINLIAFFVVAVALIAYGVVDLLGNPFRAPTSVSAVFPDASGLSSNFTVELNGVPIGTVSGVVLTKTGARVNMDLQAGKQVPGDVVASIDVANDLGQQVVELTPTHGGTAPPLRSGAVVPVSNGIPANVGEVVATATKLLAAIPPGDLNALLGDLATAFQGQAQNLRTIVSASTTFAEEFLNYQNQFTQLLTNAPPVLDAVTAVGPQLRQALVNTAALVQVLAQRRNEFDTLLKQGSAVTGQLGSLVTTQAPNLACVIHDLSQVTANLSQPANLTNISESLAANQYFFGAVNKVVVAGLAKGTRSGEADNPFQLWLRTRLYLPPKMPSALSYAHVQTVPDILPGAGCSTEFGQGVGPATQAGFQAAAGGHVIDPVASDATVRGGASSGAPLGSVRSSAYSAPGSNPMAMLMPLGGLLVPGILLAWAARPSRRRARRRG